MDRQELLELYDASVENFDAMLEEGVISPDQRDELVQDAYLELNDYLADIDGVYLEDDEDEYYEDDAVYSEETDLATFAEGVELDNRFGAALLELGYSMGYEDSLDFIEDLAEATDNTGEDIYDLIQGEALPSDEFLAATTELFGLDDDMALDYVSAGFESRGEDLGEAMAEDGYLDDEEGYEVEEAVYSRVDELEDEIANFKAEQVLKDALSERERMAQDLVSMGKMPPFVYDKVFSNFESDSDRLAAFSTMASQNGVGLESELHSMDKIIDIFNSMPEGAMMANYSADFSTPEDIDYEKALQEDAETRLRLRKQRQGGLL